MSLKQLATDHHARQSIPKKALENYLTTVAIEDISGKTHVASSWFASMMISVRAVQRVVYQYRHLHGSWPYIKNAYIVSEQSHCMADLLVLHYFSFGQLKVNDHSLLLRFYPKYQEKMPPPLTYTLVPQGNTGDVEKAYNCLQTLPFADPTLITPVAAMCADLYDKFGLPTAEKPWPVESLRVNRKACPFSGRDLQTLRRFFSPVLPVQCEGKKYTLGQLLPAGYESGSTPFKTSDNYEAFWKPVLESEIIAFTGGARTFQRMRNAAKKALQTNTFGLRRAAAAYTNKNRVISSTNVMIDETKGMPSCAETFALHKLNPGETVLAMLLLIEDGAGQLQSGAKASPCGFCRSHIVPNSRSDAPIIIEAEDEQFYMAQAGKLLPNILPQTTVKKQLEKPDNPNLFELAQYHAESTGAAVLVAECEDGDLILAGTLPNSHNDSAYPPTLAQRALLREKTLKAVMLYTPFAPEVGVVSPYLRMVLPTVAPYDCPVLLAGAEGLKVRTVLSDLITTLE